MGSLVAELAEKLSAATNSIDFDEQTLYINTSSNKVAIGTNAPVTDLTIDGTLTLKEQADADADTAAYGQIWVNTATPCELYFTTDAGNDVQITSGSALSGAFDTDAAQVFNESGADVDFRVESDDFEHMLFVDAGNDRVGIGQGTPLTTLHVNGSITSNDIVLNNLEKEEANMFDGTRGHWHIQEGSDDLFIMNQVTGKKYKFSLEEV